MKLNLIVYGLGAMALLASCSDNKGKASEASEAALKSINSEAPEGNQPAVVESNKEVSQPVVEVAPTQSEDVSKTSEPENVTPAENTVLESENPSVPENTASVDPVSEPVSEAQNVVEEVQPAEANVSSNGLSDSDLSELSESLGFPVYQSDDIGLFNEVKSWLGAPYKAAGNDKSGVDCSGLIYEIYRKIYSKELARHTAGIYDQCQSISQSDAKAGDLVFFRTDGKMEEKPNFAGIYLKNDYFVIVSSSKGVTISSLNSSYYKKNFVTAGRVRN